MPKKSTWVIDGVGLVTLAAVTLAASDWFQASESSPIAGIMIYLTWAACAIFCWHHDAAPTRPSGWIWLAVWSAIGAGIWYAFARGCAWLFFGSSEPEVSKIFDVVVALVLAPGLTAVAICGFIRSFVERRMLPLQG